MNHFKTYLPVIFSVFITVVSLVGVGIWFNTNTGSLVEQTVFSDLEDNCKSQSMAFATRLNDQLISLKSLVQYYEDCNMDDFEEIRKIMTNGRDTGIFTLVCVADKTGHSVDYYNRESNVADRLFFKKAMNGENMISRMANTAELGKLMIMSVPIIKNGKPEGVVYGIFTINELQKLIEGFNYDKDKASMLIASDTSIIVQSTNPALIPTKISNFFELGTSWGFNNEVTLDVIQQELKSNQSVIIPYENGTKERIAVLVPLGINDWYYSIITTQSVITDISKKLLNQVIVIEIVLSFTFIILLVAILFLIRDVEFVSRSNENYQLASKQNQTVIFDYDFQKKRIEFAGDIKFIVGKQLGFLNEENIDELKKYIIQEDFVIPDTVIELAQKHTVSVTKEIRLRSYTGTTYWYKILGTFTYGDDDTAKKFVGTLVNVDEAIHKEQLLKQRAEEDGLTGLLNKTAFKNRVERVLVEADSDDVYAYYIIDLDNFKQVNDSMGHIVGDRVLTDAAKKLCMIFSEADFVGRIGGDEFAAFLKLSGAGKSLAQKLIKEKAAAICAKLNEKYYSGDTAVEVSASVGISIFPENGVEYEVLYVSADQALYESKNSGKNQFHIYKKGRAEF